MSEPAERRMTIAEFLAWDDGTDQRYELVRGKVRPTLITPPAHGVILANLAAAVQPRCRPTWYAGLGAGIAPSKCEDTYYVADILISCTPVQAGETTIPKPVVIGEVVSPTTEDHDRGRKANDYRRIDSVQAIVLVASERRHVEVWRRRGSKWEIEDLIGDAELELDVLARPVPLAEIYADSGV